jgi:hypothetical protein
MAAYRDLILQFATTPTTCGDLVANAKLYLVKLKNCLEEPATLTITFSTAIAVGAVTADLALTAPVTVPVTTLFLKRGTRIYRASGVAPYVEYVELLNDTLLTQGTPSTGVQIAPALAVIATASTAQQLEALQVLSAKNVPVDYSVNTDDTKRTSDGLKARMTVTRISPTIQTELFYDLGDASVFADGYALDTFLAGADVYAIRFSSGGESMLAGRVKFSAFGETDEVDSSARLTCTLAFQNNWILTKVFRYATVAQKSAFNEIQRQLGRSQIQ